MNQTFVLVRHCQKDSICIKIVHWTVKITYWYKNEKYCNKKKYANKNFLCWNIFESLNDWNIITLVTTSKHDTEKDDKAFGTILRRIETRMSEKIFSTMYGAMRIDDKSTDTYFVVQWTREPYTLQEDNEMKYYTPLVISYAWEIVCDAIFLNPILNIKYWFTVMNKGDEDIIVRLKYKNDEDR